VGLLLAACSPVAPPLQTFRDVQKPLYSTADLPPSRLIGQWRQQAGFGANCATSRVKGAEFTVQNGAVQVAYHLCINGRIQQGQGALAGRQGRYHVPQMALPIWVLWIDADNRSMAVGTPDGSFGMILSKDAIPKDRLQAASEILAWNGYDLAKMVKLP
jgi:apolipoprotein D and lipocalin family protein